MDEVPSLYRLIKLARLFLPLLIAATVVLVELSLRGLHAAQDRFLFHLGFYGLAGPLVTWMTLEWIAGEVLEREGIQAALGRANRRLAALGQVFRRAAEAENLEQALRDLAEEVAEVLRAEVILCLEGIQVTAGSSWHSGAPLQVLNLPLPGLEEAQGALELRLNRKLDDEETEFVKVLAGEVAGALETVRRRTRDLLTLFEVDEELRAEANLDRLLERLLERIMSWASVQGGAVLLLDREGFLRPRIVRGLSLAVQPHPVEGFWKEALEGPSFLKLPSGEEILALPLLEQVPVGILLLKAEPELRTRLPFLRFLAAQVTLAVRNAQAYLRAEELALAEERNRIAREIHDGIAQSLAFMALKLDLTERLLETDPSRARKEIAIVKETLRLQIREVRRSLFALRPIDLEKYGFLESLRRYAQAFAEQADFRLRLEIPGDLNLSPTSELVLFRILQEALTNAAKHGHPSQVRVSLQPLGERGAVFEISDDGVGFEAGKENSQLGGFGLTQMRERVEGRGGIFWVHSEPGRGTTVHAELPF